MDVLGSIANGAVGGLLGGIGTLAKDIREAWTGELPPEKRSDFEQKMAELDAGIMNAQNSVNLEEAKSEKLFVSGWRPFVGWVCGINLAYSAIVYPTMGWFAKYYGSTVTFPILDNSLTSATLVGMLGLGVMRSFDKAQSPNPKGKE